ncbi:RING finger protein 212B-like isoform X3 [Polyodon spathula]|uniref:RING finger protein 212B-like isoform X3 n=1 Tax=Polyodon spathula TaxID=7913 RepID=UPI001B7E44A5|nr:RING finger protein 212B-like isoform X3 [Polyodon spathula]
MYFRNPIEVARNHFEQIAQVSVFQKKQMARVLAFYKYKSSELEIKLQEESKLSKQRESELAELRKENSELKNLLSHVKLSQSPLQQNSFFVVVVSYRGNRISRPVAITSPTLVSPRRSSCQVSRSDSMESLEQYRGNRSGGAITPGSVSTMSGRSTPQDPNFRTPTSVSGGVLAGRTPSSLSRTPRLLQFQFSSGSSLQSLPSPNPRIFTGQPGQSSGQARTPQLLSYTQSSLNQNRERRF